MADQPDDVAAELAERLRVICLALPEVTERPSHSAPTWFVQDKKSFVTLWARGHHHNQFPHLWGAAPPGAPGLPPGRLSRRLSSRAVGQRPAGRVRRRQPPPRPGPGVTGVSERP